jgi:hypothetical protein
MPLDVVDVCDDDGVSGENLRKGGRQLLPFYILGASRVRVGDV